LKIFICLQDRTIAAADVMQTQCASEYQHTDTSAFATKVTEAMGYLAFQVKRLYMAVSSRHQLTAWWTFQVFAKVPELRFVLCHFLFFL